MAVHRDGTNTRLDTYVLRPGISGYVLHVLIKIETVTVIVSAHRDDSYRSVEECARRQWADLLTERGDRWSDAGLRMVDGQPDTDVVGQRVYRFEGTAITQESYVSQS